MTFHAPHTLHLGRFANHMEVRKRIKTNQNQLLREVFCLLVDDNRRVLRRVAPAEQKSMFCQDRKFVSLASGKTGAKWKYMVWKQFIRSQSKGEGTCMAPVSRPV